MSDLPTGTVTFLFTDIEGSTKLWEQHPDAMEAALRRHDDILRACIEGHGGHVFKTVGDAFCAAFASAPDALSAALAIQRALVKETWPGGIEAIRVRMGLHTGTVEMREGDYHGPPLNRVARLEAAGHGGQILLSLATQGLVRDCLPEGVRLIDLGSHRLKDLFRPEQIFQVAADDLPVEFPPLRTLDTRRTNLPAQPTPFIGRERELAAVLALLRRDDVRLVTLSGPGGTGKTRLSLQAAADMLETYPDGVYFVDFSSIRDPELVLPTVAGILHVEDRGERPLLEALTDYLRDKVVLLVLDNFEQIVRAAPLVSELLAGAPRLKVIVTSREVLRLRGEHDYPVPPLSLPEVRRRQTVAVLSQYESVALFIQRAKAANPAFEITEENAPAVAEICVRLDGLPLAIELAAARSRMFNPKTMLERLKDRLDALRGAHDLPIRQRTLRGAIDWSYDLLSEDEKTLFRRLGVFAGGWTPEAAEAICGADCPGDVMDGLESLLDKSLIRPAGGEGSELRFTMLDTIREYAAGKLNESQDADAVRERHAVYFVGRVETFGKEWTAEKVQFALEETDNMRLAMNWSLEHDHPENVVRAGHHLWGYWSGTPWREALRWFERAIEQGKTLPPGLLAVAHRLVGNLLLDRQQYDAARIHYEQSLQIARAAGDQEGTAGALNNLAIIAIHHEADLDKARTLYEEARELYTRMGVRDGVARTAGNLATIALEIGEVDRARPLAGECLAIFREEGDLVNIIWGLSLLVLVDIASGEYRETRERLVEMTELAQQFGATTPAVSTIFMWGILAAAQGQAERAARLLANQEAIREAWDLPPLDRDDYRLCYLPALGRIKQVLSDAEFQAAWEAGQAMSVEQAFEYALAAQPD